MRLSRSLSWLALAALVSCAKGSTDAKVPTTLTVTPSPTPLTSINQTQQLTVVVTDQDGDPITGGTAPTFSTGSAAIATVSTTGLVTAKGVGSTTITVTAQGLTTGVTVNVSQTPTQFVKVQGDAQTGIENQALPTSIRVRITDALGTGVAGLTVTFGVIGGGSTTAPAATDAAGETQVTWTLGSSANAQSLTANAASLTQLNFSATAISATALNILKFVGDNQTALVGFATNIRPAVRITNAAGPVNGVTVTFNVTGGGGARVGSATVTTNANGVAQVGGWIVGGSPGANTMSAVGTGTFVGGANTVSFAAAGQTKQLNIEIRNVGPAFDPAVQAAFDSAEAFWERTLYGELSDVSINSSSSCYLGTTINETVDDVVILVKVEPIDGPGQILGSAGPCSLRGSNGIPAGGAMRFDSVDMGGLVAAGQLNGVILHEMGHVLGFTSGIWNTQAGITTQHTCAALLSSGAAGSVTSQDTHFTCASARAAFDSLGGTSYTGGNRVPLENCASGVPTSCGPGNYNSHWREAVFDKELMTPYLDAGANALSLASLATFEDLGYVVNFATAEAYTQPFTARGSSLRASGPKLDLGNDVSRAPIEIIDDRTGRVIGVIRQ